MKKIFSLMFIMACVALTANAQKGSFYLGTSGMNPFGGSQSISVGDNYSLNFNAGPMTGFNTTSYDGNDASSTSWGLAPEVGYFVSDKLAVGLGLFYTSSSFDAGVSGVDAIALNTFGANPYVRYYFLKKGDFSMYGQGNFVYSTTKFDTKGAESTDYFSVNVRPGIAYSLSDRFSINATYGYLGYEDIKDNSSSFGLNLNMSSLAFGFSVSF